MCICTAHARSVAPLYRAFFARSLRAPCLASHLALSSGPVSTFHTESVPDLDNDHPTIVHAVRLSGKYWRTRTCPRRPSWPSKTSSSGRKWWRWWCCGTGTVSPLPAAAVATAAVAAWGRRRRSRCPPDAACLLPRRWVFHCPPLPHPSFFSSSRPPSPHCLCGLSFDAAVEGVFGPPIGPLQATAGGGWVVPPRPYPAPC